jgi:ribonuclease VapC
MRLKGMAGDPVGALVSARSIRVLPFDRASARAASDAYRIFGKGMKHPAQLNFADCAAYALAKALGARLLFVGNDFARTDLRSALATT